MAVLVRPDDRLPFTVAAGVSGTRDEQAAASGYPRMAHRLAQVPAQLAIVHGACTGVDILAAIYCKNVRGMHVHAVVPARLDRVDPRWLLHCDSFEVMAPGTTYRDRDQRLIDLSSVLYAFPLYGEHDPRSIRSGTWMTVRMAREKGIQCLVETLR